MGLLNWSEQVDEGLDLLEVTSSRYGEASVATMLVDSGEAIVGGDVRGRRFLKQAVAEAIDQLQSESDRDVVVCRYTQAELMSGKRTVPRELVVA